MSIEKPHDTFAVKIYRELMDGSPSYQQLCVEIKRDKEIEELKREFDEKFGAFLTTRHVDAEAIWNWIQKKFL